MYCPKCKSDRAHRSHRRGLWERLAGILSFYPYRCRECYYRFLRFRYGKVPDREGGPTSTEREIRSTRSAIRWRRKKQEVALYLMGLVVFLIILYFITRPASPQGS